MITVTKTYLPDRKKYFQLLDTVWNNAWVTNNGPLLTSLETRLIDFLKVDYLQYVNNGTIALQLAIKGLGLKGKIITTPFSYVATLNSILWENCEPVFVDIVEDTLTIDPDAIEKRMDKDTVAVLATHVYGIPCDVLRIEEIGKKYGIKIIYDAAHSFNTFIGEKSVLSFGDVSTLSFHATKIFHTIEGGAIICNNAELNEKLFLLKSFGHKADRYFSAGINGKNSEFHAGMGHLVLDDFNVIQANRKLQHDFYTRMIDEKSLDLIRPVIAPDVKYNYSYYPIVFPNEKVLVNSIVGLNAENIFPRRYFYPSLNTLPYLSNKISCPVSENISSRVLCLPLFHDLTKEDQERIVSIIQKSFGNG